MSDGHDGRVFFIIVSILILILVSICFIFCLDLNITGRVIAAYGVAGDSSDEIGTFYDSNSVYLWTPKNNYAIRGLGLTGSASGDGVFKAFLVTPSKQFLIYTMYLENEQVNFSSVCRNTCHLDYPLNEEKYFLRFELEGVEVKLNSVHYSSYTLDEGIFEKTSLGEFLGRVTKNRKESNSFEDNFNLTDNLKNESNIEPISKEIKEESEEKDIENFKEKNKEILEKIKENLELKATLNDDVLIDKTEIYADRDVEIISSGMEGFQYVVRLKYEGINNVPLEIVGNITHSINFENNETIISIMQTRFGIPKFDVRIGGFE